MSAKCAYCGKEIKPNCYVWVYQNEEAIHQDCVGDWAFGKLENDLVDMPGSEAIQKLGSDENERG